MIDPLAKPIKTDSLFRKQLRTILNDLIVRLENNNDIEIKTDRAKVLAYLADGVVKTQFMRDIRNGPGDKLIGPGFAQG